jgi:hypothetical protein
VTVVLPDVLVRQVHDAVDVGELVEAFLHPQQHPVSIVRSVMPGVERHGVLFQIGDDWMLMATVRMAAIAMAWEKAAWENSVFPLQDGRGGGYLDIRRPAEQELAKPVTLLPGTPKLERYRSSKLTALLNFTISATSPLT